MKTELVPLVHSEIPRYGLGVASSQKPSLLTQVPQDPRLKVAVSVTEDSCDVPLGVRISMASQDEQESWWFGAGVT